MEMGLRHQIPTGPRRATELLATVCSWERKRVLCKSAVPQGKATHPKSLGNASFVLFFKKDTKSGNRPGKSWRRGEYDQNRYKTLKRIKRLLRFVLKRVWAEGSVVKSTCSCRGPRFDSQHPKAAHSHLNSSSRESDTVV